jgi:hypothetical protein
MALSVLEDKLGLPFMTSYATRLGNFEVFELHPWLDQPQPFVIECVSRPSLVSNGCETWEIARTPAFAESHHFGHFVGEVAGDVVVDQLITLAPGRLRTPIVSPEPLDHYTFRLFDASGVSLLHTEQHHMLNRIGINLSPQHRQLTIEDELSRRAKNHSSALGTSAGTVGAYTSQRSIIGAPPADSWRRFADEMHSWIATHTPPPSEDRWFRRGIEGEVGAVTHLAELMSGANVRAAVLVDPWFGEDALRRLVLRLGSRDLHLTIVTSWATVDPDTNLPLGAHRQPMEKLEETLNRLQPLINPRLAVINVLDGRERAFHDRYLLLYPHETTPKVFLLSNSINKASYKWPFVVSQLSRDVGCEVQRYIEGLLQGNDVARGRVLTIGFRWPDNAE